MSIPSSALSRSVPLRPAVLLIAGGLLVAAAIVAGGTAARALNGLGALAWLAGSALLLWSLGRSGARWLPAVAAIGATLVLVVIVRPNEYPEALLGFLLGGALAAATGRDRPIAWALAVPALWLPVHLALGVLPAILAGGGAVRSVPPPTPPFLPLSMIVAAWIGGGLVAWLWEWRSRSRGPADVATELGHPGR